MNLQTHIKNPNSSKGTFIYMESPRIIDITNSPNTIQGPVNVGPKSGEYGIALSYQLAKDLNVNNGDFVYFKLL